MSLALGDIFEPAPLWERFAERFCDDLENRLRVMGRALPPVLESPCLDYGLYLVC